MIEVDTDTIPFTYDGIDEDPAEEKILPALQNRFQLIRVDRDRWAPRQRSQVTAYGRA
jgi:hypothetical protein